MKIFKKLMAGAMAIAMLSAYTVALATGGSESTVSGANSSEVTLHGNFGGSEVFLMKMPTAAANASLSFTVDPKESIHNSPPTNAIVSGDGQSTWGTVIFSVSSGSAPQNTTYSNTSKPLQVISMCSTDVTVNMIATLSDTKMKFSTSSGFTGDDAKSHLYLGVKVETLSGGTATAVPVTSGGLQPVTELGAMQATTLKTVAGNFTTKSGGAIKLVSGAANESENAEKAADITDDKWTGVQYTVIGYSNPNADWQIKNLSAPELKIKWVVDTSNDVTYDPNLISTYASTTTYTAKLDKATYKAGETATIYVQPKDAEAKLTNVTLNYIGLNAQEKMTTEANKKFSVQATKVNGVYSATLQWPTDMARPESEKGDITTYAKPTWEIEVG